jgi:hypothetical protein
MSTTATLRHKEHPGAAVDANGKNDPAGVRRVHGHDNYLHVRFKE